MQPELIVAGIMLLCLLAYVLSGGADFGSGVWDLLASGPRARRQRELIAHAIAPIWEANHVWLIALIVLLFACFPPAFAAVSTALHLPLTGLLIGIVLRGSAFVFRAYGGGDEVDQRRWGLIFAIGSVISPVMLGVVLGAIAAGGLPMDPDSGRVATDFYSAWVAPFPFAIGGLTLAIFAYLAAVYLAVEAEAPALKDDFRARALGAAVAVGGFAFLALLLADTGAPRVWEGLTGQPWSLPFQIVVGALALGAIGALVKRRYRWARRLAAAQVIGVALGWAAGQYPYLLPPDLTFADAASPPSVLWATIGVFAAGSVLLVPAYVWLLRVFKRDALTPGGEAET